MLAALAERHWPQINAVKPDHIKGHIGGCPCVSKQVIELRPACLVGRDDLTVENRVAGARGFCKGPIRDNGALADLD